MYDAVIKVRDGAVNYDPPPKGKRREEGGRSNQFYSHVLLIPTHFPPPRARGRGEGTHSPKWKWGERVRGREAAPYSSKTTERKMHGGPKLSSSSTSREVYGPKPASSSSSQGGRVPRCHHHERIRHQTRKKPRKEQGREGGALNDPPPCARNV